VIKNRKYIIKEETKTNKMPMPSESGASPRSVKAVRMEPVPERLWRKGFVKQMTFKSGKNIEGVLADESEDGD